MKIFVFGEGATEQQVYSKLVKLNPLNFDSKYISADSKSNLNKKAIATIGSSLGVRAVRCVLLRDLDDGESEPRICQSITDAFQRDLESRNFKNVSLNLVPHTSYPNVYLLHQSDIDLRLSVHIATYQWNPKFKNRTTDDYILELALRPTLLTKLATKLGISPEQFSTKITDELPDLLKRNGIIISEAKNYLQMYAALNKVSSLTGFVSKIMNNADETDIREIFQPMLAAFEFAGGA